MCQRRYVDDILKRFAMDECKAVVSRRHEHSTGSKRRSDQGERSVSRSCWCSDALDDCHAPGHRVTPLAMCRRFMENPQEEHWLRSSVSFATCKAPRRMDLLQAG
ncbi:hypothetical protein Pcac1_g29112 [Phytophthora cactorum]|nr:hypothetical protein Pcac1_g29112 [Phytophthora cactorum]